MNRSSALPDRLAWASVVGAALLLVTACGAATTPRAVDHRSSTTLATAESSSTGTSTSVAATSTTTTVARSTTATTVHHVLATTATTAPRVTAAPATATSTCAAGPANQMKATGGGSQLMTVVASSTGATTATVTLWQRVGACWTVAYGPWSGWVGSNGLSSQKVEGDGTAPIGLFGISSTFYGIDPNPGVHGTYHQLVCGDWWDEEPSSPEYNTFEHVNSCSTADPFGGGSEALWTEAPAYDGFAVIEYNTSPIVPGKGSAIFLHVSLGRPTSGCVSLPFTDLIATLRWLQPGDSPHIAIGTAADIESY